MRGTFRRYEIRDRIAVGSTSEVFRAAGVAPDGTRRVVALKLLQKRLCDSLEERQAFLESGRALLQLRHPGLVAVLELGVMDRRPFAAMEHVDGADVGRLVARARALGRAPSESVAVDITVEALRTLRWLHAEGAIHGDLDASNVLVSRSGAVKLADPGCSGRWGARPGAHPAFLAPERLRGATPDARSDVWSGGMLLLLLLTGTRPFERLSLAEVLEHVMRGKGPDLADVDDPSLAAIIRRATSAHPLDRFGSALELEVALLDVAALRKLRFDAEERAWFVATALGHAKPQTLHESSLPSIVARIDSLIAEEVAGAPDERVFETARGIPDCDGGWDDLRPLVVKLPPWERMPAKPERGAPIEAPLATTTAPGAVPYQGILVPRELPPFETTETTVG